jgi:hypothetical protein
MGRQRRIVRLALALGCVALVSGACDGSGSSAVGAGVAPDVTSAVTSPSTTVAPVVTTTTAAPTTTTARRVRATTTTTAAPEADAAPAASSSGSCHPSYQGTCIPPDVSDADCYPGSGNGPWYVKEDNVKVVGPDVFDLDRDGDGIGCEA